MDIYLLAEKAPDLHIPVNPGEFRVDLQGKTQTLGILGLGEVEVPVGTMPGGVTFGSFFPRHYDPGYCRYAAIPRPEDALARLLDWRTSGEPVRLLITHSPVNMLVFVSKVTYRYAGGEPGDIYYELTLRQWRDLRVLLIAAAEAGAGVAALPRPDTKAVPKVYTVKSGDTLYAIAKTELGDGTRWREIYNLNVMAIGPDPNLILPGQALVMPA